MEAIFSTAYECETAFYAAFNACDYRQMMKVWSSEAAVLCVHPGGSLLQGREAVLSSWQQILSAANPLQISVSEHHIIEHGDLAVRVVHENIHHGPELRDLSVVLATNVFARESAGWKLFSHHASSAPPRLSAPHPRRPRGTMH